MLNLPKYLVESLSFEERAKDLVSQMTLEEKTMQMLYSAPAIPRLGIQAYNWWNEALHGVARAGVATVFPQAIGLAATFDEELIFKIADVISSEGRAKYNEFQKHGDRDIYKGITFWSPNINIFRDPRWGRGHETYGEDPYLTSRLGVAFIKGIQGDHPKYLKAAACAKHFAVHSGPESERHSFNAQVTKKDLWETYLPAFEVCVKEAKVEAIMGAYNRTNGEPCCGSKTLLQEILRDKWKFKGHVTSDCWAIKDFHEFHGVTSTAPESVALAVNNGCDMNCGNMYLNLQIAYNEGLVSEDAIDKCVNRLMLTRLKLGMFDSDENVPFANIPYEIVDCKEHNNLSLDAAKKSLVLLKNKDNLLPIDKNRIRNIAVIGPNADSKAALEGNYCGTASEYITVLDGIRRAIPDDVRLTYAQGCDLFKDRVEALAQPKDRLAEAVSIAKRADVAIVCLGLDASIEGEEGDESNEYASGDKVNLNLPAVQQELLEKIYATGVNVVLVLLSGSALAVNWADENIASIIHAWYPGAQGGKAVASLIFGDFSPSGRLPVTFYRSSEELPDFRDYSMKNRTYRYMENDALYPFGYGLSYSSFEYSDLIISNETIKVGDAIKCSAMVKNTGEYDSDEIVQLYIKIIDASVKTPNFQLIGFKRIRLNSGEKQKVMFEITSSQMSIVDENGERVTEPGIFKVFIGGSQPDKRSLELTCGNVLNGYFELEI